ncbi:NBR1-Ig-like domain-containing protein [Mycobacteroides abscessus]|uniref:NBR1-Ig-like domain-containing protein n=1 Tax=Mycobacteroides abscessus TaxID=36809 RepID=UPI001EEE026D|nr:NBR1-Ig-like domain-containing protein [Mycobacteroides abscessus]
MARQDSAVRELGQLLRYLREACGVTLTQTAQQLGVSKAHLSNIERGRDRPSAKIIGFYDQRYGGYGQAWGLYEALITEGLAPQRLPLDRQPDYPIPGDALTFVANVTIPDGTVMVPNQMFEKTWRIRNSGTVPWKGRWLARDGTLTGHRSPLSPPKILIANTSPGQEIDITVPMRAQQPAGGSQTHWKMVDNHGWEYLPDLHHAALVVSIVVGRSEILDARGQLRYE